MNTTEKNKHAFNKATKIFGSKEAAINWLKAPNKVLGGITPAQTLSVSYGTEEVMDILGRVEWGIYS